MIPLNKGNYRITTLETDTIDTSQTTDEMKECILLRADELVEQLTQRIINAKQKQEGRQFPALPPHYLEFKVYKNLGNKWLQLLDLKIDRFTLQEM